MGDYLYQGTSSLEELFATDPLYDCCNFAGEFYKLDLAGIVAGLNPDPVWRFQTIDPSIHGTDKFSGSSVWGSSPSVDLKTNTVFIATGNNYDAPDDYIACFAADLAPGQTEAERAAYCNDELNGGIYSVEEHIKQEETKEKERRKTRKRKK